MHRFHLPPAECVGDVFTLSAREAHHALHVLRLRAGDRVVVLDGAGHEFHCQLIDSSRRGAALRVIEQRTPPALTCAITLLQAVPKAKAMDAIIQKATELGARRIVPLLTERCTVQLEARDATDKQFKWQQTAIEALKQSGASWLPRIDPPSALEQFLARGEQFDLALVGALRPGGGHPRRCFADFTEKHQRAPESVAVWVGPEGDFTAAELDSIEAAGVQPVTLGPQVLRCDTAAAYLLAIVGYETQPGGSL
jgi:16S rRNA (uracil1498-N3)-methyltransferase